MLLRLVRLSKFALGMRPFFFVSEFKQNFTSSIQQRNQAYMALEHCFGILSSCTSDKVADAMKTDVQSALDKVADNITYLDHSAIYKFLHTFDTRPDYIKVNKHLREKIGYELELYLQNYLLMVSSYVEIDTFLKPLVKLQTGLYSRKTLQRLSQTILRIDSFSIQDFESLMSVLAYDVYSSNSFETKQEIVEVVHAAVSRLSKVPATAEIYFRLSHLQLHLLSPDYVFPRFMKQMYQQLKNNKHTLSLKQKFQLLQCCHHLTIFQEDMEELFADMLREDFNDPDMILDQLSLFVPRFMLYIKTKTHLFFDVTAFARKVLDMLQKYMPDIQSFACWKGILQCQKLIEAACSQSAEADKDIGVRFRAVLLNKILEKRLPASYVLRSIEYLVLYGVKEVGDAIPHYLQQSKIIGFDYVIRLLICMRLIYGPGNAAPEIEGEYSNYCRMSPTEVIKGLNRTILARINQEETSRLVKIVLVERNRIVHASFVEALVASYNTAYLKALWDKEPALIDEVLQQKKYQYKFVTFLYQGLSVFNSDFFLLLGMLLNRAQYLTAKIKNTKLTKWAYLTQPKQKVLAVLSIRFSKTGFKPNPDHDTYFSMLLAMKERYEFDPEYESLVLRLFTMESASVASKQEVSCFYRHFLYLILDPVYDPLPVELIRKYYFLQQVKLPEPGSELQALAFDILLIKLRLYRHIKEKNISQAVDIVQDFQCITKNINASTFSCLNNLKRITNPNFVGDCSAKQLVQLLGSGIRLFNFDKYLNQLINLEDLKLSPKNLLRIVRTIELNGAVATGTVNWVIDNYGQLHTQMHPNHKQTILSFLSRSKVRIEQIILNVLESSSSLQILNSLFELGYYSEPEIEDYCTRLLQNMSFLARAMLPDDLCSYCADLISLLALRVDSNPLSDKQIKLFKAMGRWLPLQSFKKKYLANQWLQISVLVLASQDPTFKKQIQSLISPINSEIKFSTSFEKYEPSPQVLSELKDVKYARVQGFKYLFRQANSRKYIVVVPKEECLVGSSKYPGRFLLYAKYASLKDKPARLVLANKKFKENLMNVWN